MTATDAAAQITAALNRVTETLGESASVLTDAQARLDAATRLYHDLHDLVTEWDMRARDPGRNPEAANAYRRCAAEVSAAVTRQAVALGLEAGR